MAAVAWRPRICVSPRRYRSWNDAAGGSVEIVEAFEHDNDVRRRGRRRQPDQRERSLRPHGLPCGDVESPPVPSRRARWHARDARLSAKRGARRPATRNKRARRAAGNQGAERANAIRGTTIVPDLTPRGRPCCEGISALPVHARRRAGRSGVIPALPMVGAHIRVLVGAPEELSGDHSIEQRVARRRIEIPESLRLTLRQVQAGDLVVFRADQSRPVF
jgi:hypothetical protein